MFGVNATLTTESNGYVVLMLTGIADLREYQVHIGYYGLLAVVGVSSTCGLF